MGEFLDCDALALPISPQNESMNAQSIWAICSRLWRIGIYRVGGNGWARRYHHALEIGISVAKGPLDTVAMCLGNTVHPDPPGFCTATCPTSRFLVQVAQTPADKR